MFNQKDKIKNIDTKMSIVDYVELVNDITDGYFDLISGEYQPHLGIANCMQLFYNKFYKDKDENDVETVDAFEAILREDDCFISTFNEYLVPEKSFAYDFSHAYIDAMDIVNTKKDSIERMFSGIRDSILNTLNAVTNVMNQDDIDKLLELSKRVFNGEVTAEKVLDTYKDSRQYKNLIKEKQPKR